MLFMYMQAMRELEEEAKKASAAQPRNLASFTDRYLILSPGGS